MKTSSAQIKEIEDVDVYGDRSAIPGVVTADGSSARMLNTEKSDNAKLYAETSRLAGRLNATHVSEEERTKLLAEREKLLNKKLSTNSLTKRELNKLALIRWSLDRIEDAKHGHVLDRLENAIMQYERFAEDIVSLQTQLASLLSARKYDK